MFLRMCASGNCWPTWDTWVKSHPIPRGKTHFNRVPRNPAFPLKHVETPGELP